MKKKISSLLLLGFLLGCAERQPPDAAVNYLRYVIAAPPNSLDPAATQDLSFYQIAFNILETLIAVNWQTGAFEPALATSWQPDSLHLRWTFVLRRGVFFHDGSPLNAAAVKASFERQFLAASPYYHPKLTDRYSLTAFDMMKEIRAPNDSTVQFILKYPHAAFLDNLASPYYATIVSQQGLATYGENFGRHPIGTGPFEFARWDSKGGSIVIKKNSRYWREPAQLDSVVFQVIPGLEARINDLRQGRAEVISNLSAASVFSFYGDTSITMIEEQSLGVVLVGIKNNKPPFNILQARQALAHAINREYIVKNLGRNLSLLAKGILPPMLAYYDSTLTTLPYDTAKARTLLQNGAAPRRVLQFGYYADTDSLRRSPLLQEIVYELKQAGIPTIIRSYNDWREYETETLKGDSADLFIWASLSYTRHPENFLYALFHSQSPQNYCGYANAEVDALLEQARRTRDAATQQQLYRRVQEIILREAPAIFISHPKIVYAIRARVKNFRASPLGIPQLTAVTVEKSPPKAGLEFLR